MVITILKIYIIFIFVLMLIYAVRHAIFAYHRIYKKQRIYYGSIQDSEMPPVTILIPMYNEEQVLEYVLDSLIDSYYPQELMEIIPINDNSTDKTKELLDEYAEKYSFINPIHRQSDLRGKVAALNDALKVARNEIILVFDADYRPSKELIHQLVAAFKDPEAGAVMGRVIPHNAAKNWLTRLLNLERSGGYQADQQARYNLRTVPQYGGTVGGFRKSLVMAEGGFDTRVLAEDTELTFRLFTKGWKVIYANSAECYEEVPENWNVRARQIRRWSRGHNQVMFKYFFPVMFSKHMNAREKLDGLLLLIIYLVPFLFMLGLIDSIILFFLGEIGILTGWWVILFLGAYNSYGNFAPFYEIATAALIDGIKNDVLLLPLLTFNFYFYLWNITLGFFDAVADSVSGRYVHWAKTERFAKSKRQKETTK
ncbi:MAG: glycosyltransferase family 2 protein [Clostridia bacterium]|nr:glycosyltransferase family 2 protein [Clostridia bacterium]